MAKKERDVLQLLVFQHHIFVFAALVAFDLVFVFHLLAVTDRRSG